MSQSLKEQYASSPLFGSNASAVESLYEQYLDDPASVPERWRRYFGEMTPDSGGEVAHGPIREAFRERSLAGGGNGGGATAVARAGRTRAVTASEKQAAVSRLIQVYSLRGHQIADLDPLGLQERHVPAVLKFDFLGLSDADLDDEFYTGGLAGTGHERMKLRDILALLRRIYCGKIGAEFAHISRARERLWLRERFEQGIDRKSVV